MKVAYISGPYRAPSIDGTYNNIHNARRIAREYWLKGYAVICPHMNTAMMDGRDTDEMFLDGDIEILKRCDAIVMIEGWENSIGARMELAAAERHGLEVIYHNA